MSASARWRRLACPVVLIGWSLLPTGCGSSDNSAPSVTTTMPVETSPEVDRQTPVTPAAYASPAPLGEARPAVAPASGEAAVAQIGSVFTAGGVSLKVVDAAAYNQAIQNHRGRIVLVDFWATWCGPCKEEFPQSVALGRKWQEKLAVVSVSFDEPENYASVIEFLKQQDAKFDNLMSPHGNSVESGVTFDIVGGALPFYKLYDRSGKLRYQFTANIDDLEGVLKTEELEKRVEELLAEGA